MSLNAVCAIGGCGNCAGTLKECMFRMQHRGQQYCGVGANDGSTEPRISVKTAQGMVLSNIENGTIDVPGRFCIGVNSSAEEQPIKMIFLNGEFAFGFDGFVANERTARARLLGNGFGFRTYDQVETLAGMIIEARDVEVGMKALVNQVDGPFAAVALSPIGIFAARDGRGMRPLVLGRGKDGTIAVASESCAFYGTGIELVRDVAPGEVLFFDTDELVTVATVAKQKKVCCFEWVYFARPDSVIEGTSVAEARHRLGRFLAEKDNIDADVVGPVPFSGIMHAEGYHLASGLPSVEVFMPPRYLGRTYIRPYDQRVAEKARKLVPVPVNVRGKRIVLVDDSIRAGVTMAGIIEALREAGAREVHVRVASPVSTRDCPHARPPSEGEYFIGKTMSVEQIRRRIGADTLRYQELDHVAEAIGLPTTDLCLDCFL